ncbi:helix-turn-helix domain-containing protein [Antarcticirhabdus aurantiaca]|uniref:Helix-turn-helix transcriptional regulator n=1 Tax=Antarcticirhabdus aurantiaca TaxID=2606717 RepID=A0ACD4NJ22_9HYPH|nr:helix-turn-helix transcriptional regulator [Jeongeuplla avenae]
MGAQPNRAEDPERLALRKRGGVWLKERREAAGLTQREFAEKVEVGYYTFISQIELGRGRIPPERYRDWAEALNMDPREFVRELLAFYEPSTHGILFGEGEAS